jgi:hypothetical protein
MNMSTQLVEIKRPKRTKIKAKASLHNTYVITYPEAYMVVTSVLEASKNIKTGAMIQTYLISRERLTESSVFGAKCNECPLVKECYVQRDKMSVRRALVRLLSGESTSYVHATLDEVMPLLNGRSVRFGSYGDPTSIPYADLKRISEACVEWTGYTHFWRSVDHRYSALLMASVESTDGELEAWANGWRPFRVILNSDDRVLITENMIECPHYTRGVQCITCGLCKGTSSKAKGVYVFEH